MDRLLNPLYVLESTESSEAPRERGGALNSGECE